MEIVVKAMNRQGDGNSALASQKVIFPACKLGVDWWLEVKG